MANPALPLLWLDGRALVTAALSSAERDDLGLQGVVTLPDLQTVGYLGDRLAARAMLRESGLGVPEARTYEGLDLVAAIDDVSEQFGWPIMIKRRRRLARGQDQWVVFDRSEVGAIAVDLIDTSPPLLLEQMPDSRFEVMATYVRASGVVTLVDTWFRNRHDDDDPTPHAGIPHGMSTTQALAWIGDVVADLGDDGIFWSTAWTTVEDFGPLLVSELGVGFHPSVPLSRDFDAIQYFD
jgi:phosphoribosylaminoimidazole carboxylase (NCAIR synthetase)